MKKDPIEFVNKLHKREEFIKILGEKLVSEDLTGYCLVTIDIEHFKLFNKWYGREKGDEFLNSFAEILYYLELDGQGVCGYFGGDDFTMLIKYDSIEFNRVQEDFNQCAMDIGKIIGFLPAYGIYIIKDQSVDAMVMYDMCNLALSQVKGNYEERTCIYTEDMSDDVEKEMHIISEVKKAIDRGQFTFYIQPKCNIVTGKIVGAEALVRWNHPEKGVVSPGLFIPVLEENGFISDLDRYVWQEVCKWMGSLKDKGLDPVPVSINVSRIDMLSLNVPEILLELTEKYDIDHHLIKVEITESAYAEVTDKVRDALKRLRAEGFTVLMDDFGSGYSSLNMLKSFKIDIIKIDMRFLDISEDVDGKGFGILESVVNMSSSMGIPIIVEGVENKKQEEYLLGMGCRFAQGYYYYKPMPADEFETLLSDKKNIDFTGVVNDGVKRIRIKDLFTKNIFSDNIINSIVGPFAIFEVNNGDINITITNDEFFNLFFDGKNVEDGKLLNKAFKELYEKDKKKIDEAFARAFDDKIKGSELHISTAKKIKNFVADCRIFFMQEDGSLKRFIVIVNKTDMMNSSKEKISDYNNEEFILKNVEKLCATSPNGLCIIKVDRDDEELSASPIYINREGSRMIKSDLERMVKYFRLLNMKYKEKFDKLLLDIAFYNDTYNFTTYVEDSGKYVEFDMYMYLNGYIVVSMHDVTELWLYQNHIINKFAGNGDIFFVNIEEDTYRKIHPFTDVVSSGNYSEEIDSRINTYNIIDPDGCLREFLSLSNIKKFFKEDNNTEMKQKFEMHIKNTGTVMDCISCIYPVKYNSRGEIASVILTMCKDNNISYTSGYDKVIKINEFFKLKVLTIDLENDNVMNLSEQSYDEWVKAIGDERVTFSKIVSYVADVQMDDNYKDSYRALMDRDRLINKYNDLNHQYVENFEYKLLNHGKVLWVKVELTVDKYIDGKIYLIANFSDITKTKNEEFILEMKADTDSLTGIYNRSGVIAKMETVLNGNKNSKYSLIMIDLDNFKLVNDWYGHAYGDQILKNVSLKLIEGFGKEAIVGRIGGDEFIVMLKYNEIKMIEERMQNVINDIYTEYERDNESFILSASMGYAIYPENGDSFVKLFNKADLAMYYVKKKGKNTFYRYNDELDK